MQASERTVEVSELLQRCQLFKDLPYEDIAQLAEYARRQKHLAGSVIFRAGDSGQALVGLLSGQVRIIRPAIEGNIIIGDFAPGEVFGEIAVLDGEGRSADAHALTNCELVILDRRYVVPFLMERPQLMMSLIMLVCRKLRDADERASDFAFLPLERRLAKTLLRLGGQTSSSERPGRVSLTQGDLARTIGATRPNVNRQLKQWERSGIVKQSKGWIVLLDVARLSEISIG